MEGTHFPRPQELTLLLLSHVSKKPSCSNSSIVRGRRLMPLQLRFMFFSKHASVYLPVVAQAFRCGKSLLHHAELRMNSVQLAACLVHRGRREKLQE